MTPSQRKASGSYYTPDDVAQCLVQWVVRAETERMLDPSCGDGRFIARHANAVGIEQDADAAQLAVARAPWALVHEGDFFSWASRTHERFECAAGNPPFIRYQTFRGELRQRALNLCASVGARFSGLSSSWAPFIVATATLLKSGGRLAFVVPAEIGHAPYSAPLLEFLCANFGVVHIVAVRQKLFPKLSEDCWLLYADGYGRASDEIRFSTLPQFRATPRPPASFTRVALNSWRNDWNCRLRPFVLSAEARDLYAACAAQSDSRRLGDLAKVGIGYVSGANDFFHLRPSEAASLRIPKSVLHPTVRNGRALPAKRVTNETVENWLRNDEEVLLLRIEKQGKLPISVSRYLDTAEAEAAREAYKCRSRDPWYSVPDVQIPDFFLSYMSGIEAGLVKNEAGCTCTNSVHSVRLRKNVSHADVSSRWGSPLTKLSCEIEGHPLGGGMLKIEPREAARIVMPAVAAAEKFDRSVVADALATLREWRHYGSAT